jgi:hypothetical protein
MKERRSLEPRRGSDARAERSYDAARRRIDGLEKALTLIAGSMTPGSHQVDQGKVGQFRLGIDIARSLLAERLPAAKSGAENRAKRENNAS